MKNAIKTIHILGFAMLLGGTLGIIILNAVTNNSSDLVIIANQSQIISTLVGWLVVPGAITIMTSGLAMILLRKLNPLKLHWLAIKLTLGVIVGASSAAILAPLSEKLATLAAQNSVHGLITSEYEVLKGNQILFGYAIIGIILIITITSVYKPIFRRSAH